MISLLIRMQIQNKRRMAENHKTDSDMVQPYQSTTWWAQAFLTANVFKVWCSNSCIVKLKQYHTDTFLNRLPEEKPLQIPQVGFPTAASWWRIQWWGVNADKHNCLYNLWMYSWLETATTKGYFWTRQRPWAFQLAKLVLVGNDTLQWHSLIACLLMRSPHRAIKWWKISHFRTTQLDNAHISRNEKTKKAGKQTSRITLFDCFACGWPACDKAPSMWQQLRPMQCINMSPRLT